MTQQKDIDYLTSMSRVVEALSQTIDIEEKLQQFVKLIFEIFHCDHAWLLYPDNPHAETSQVLYEYIQTGYSEEHQQRLEIPITQNVIDMALASNTPLTFMSKSEGFSIDDAANSSIIQSRMVTAVYPQIGEPWLLGLQQCGYKRKWNSNEKNLLSNISSHLANALTEKLLKQQLLEREKRTAALLQLTQNLESAHSYLDVLQAAHEIIESTLGYKNSWLYIYSEDLKIASHLCSVGTTAEKFASQYPLLQIESNPLFKETAENTKIVIVSDARTDPRANQEFVAQFDNRTIVKVPILLYGERIALLSMGSFGEEGVNVPNHAQLGLLAAVGKNIEVSLDHIILTKEVEQRAKNQTTLALENAQLYDTANRRANELAILMRLSQIISSNLDLETLINTTYQCVGQLMDNHSFWIATYEKGAEYGNFLIRIDNGERYPNDKFSVNAGFVGYTIRTGNPILTNDPLEFYRQKQIPSLHYGDPKASKSLIIIPLLIGDQVTGAMSTQSYRQNAYSQDDLESLIKLAQPIAIALENARLFSAEKAARERMDRLQAATQALSTTLDLPKVFELILSELRRVIAYDSTSVQQLKGNYLEIIGGHGFPNLEELVGYRFKIDEAANPNFKVMQTRKPVILSNAPTRFSDFHTEPHAQAGIRSWLGVPLIFGDELIGMIALDKQEEDFYTEEHAQIAQAFAAQAASAIFNAQLYDQLSDYAAQLEIRVQERTSELASANEQLKELDRLKSKFVSDVSHELRTPVTNLNLYLDLLQRGKQEQWPRYFDVLREQVNRLRQLIEDILDLSRLDLAANTKIEMEPVDLNEIINLVVVAHKLRAEKSGLQLNFKPYESSALVLGERNQLVQVITNLVVNSINYTNTGHIRLICNLEAKRNMICVEISDTGMGIPQEDLNHIFDRFYRGQETSQLTIPGNGLGLAIVKEIVQQHNGEIEVSSIVGAGSTFRIYLPILSNN